MAPAHCGHGTSPASPDPFAADSSEPAPPSASAPSHALGAPDLSNIVELNLERRHIRRLQNLASLTSLRSASFLDNQVSGVFGGYGY